MPFAKATFSAAGPMTGTHPAVKYGVRLCAVQAFAPIAFMPELAQAFVRTAHPGAKTMRKFFRPKTAPQKTAWRWLALACFVASVPATALAEAPWMPPLAFQDLVQGQVMRTQHEHSGEVFGHEAFGPDRSVIWQYPDGRCLVGQWQAKGGSICYRYDGIASESCLRYRVEAGQIIGHQWRQSLGDWGDSGEKLLLTPSPGHRMTCGPQPNS